ncbi:thioredoxin-like protein [Baffinella frigidus]|nr:thioredoxin-like protein [Cryptophyta sp. CCMP2293]
MLVGKVLRSSALAARPMTVAAASRAASGSATRGAAFALARAAPAAVARPWTGFPAAQCRQMATVGSEGSDSDFAKKTKEPAAPSGERDVQAEIKEMVTTRPVVLFMKGTPDHPQCGFSNRTVQILDHHKTAYGAFNVLEDAVVREGIKKYSAWPTIPQLYIKGEFVGGCDIIMEMHESGELLKLIEAAKA